MEANEKFKVVYSSDAREFLQRIEGIEILVIATHGFIKKTAKTPPKEIASKGKRDNESIF